MTALSLRQKVTSGVLWSAGARIVQLGYQFGVSIVLARLLSPEDYGLIAMVMVFTGFAGMLADAGFNAALIQRKELNNAHQHTAFWASLSLAVAVSAVTFLLAPAVATFFSSPATKLILRVNALNLVFSSIGIVPSALLQRQMRFRTIAKIETGALVISGAVGVSMAVLGAGVWSLVAQSLSNCFLIAVMRCRSCRWLPKATFCRNTLREIWSFTGHLYGFNFINYWARNADNLLVGKFFGPSALGAYNRAYTLMLLPISQINGVIYQVVFSAFSSIQGDKNRIKMAFLRVVSIVSLFAFPLMVGLLVVAEPFVLTLYGPKWRHAVLLIQILAPVGALQVFINLAGMLFASQGRTDRLLRWGTCMAALMLLAFGFGVSLGSVEWVAGAYAIANLLFFVPGLATAGRVIDMSIRHLLEAAAGPFWCSLMMGVFVFCVRSILPQGWPAWKALALSVFSGIGCYGLAISIFQLSAWKQFLAVIHEKFGQYRPARDSRSWKAAQQLNLRDNVK